MQTIYYKEAPKNPESLKELLKHYFNLHAPCTYWSDTDELQCDSSRNRSIEDYLLLSNYYFPGTSIKDMMKAFLEFNKDLCETKQKLIFDKCSTIQRIRLCSHTFGIEFHKTKNMLYIPGMKEIARNGDYQMTDLAKIMEDIND